MFTCDAVRSSSSCPRFLLGCLLFVSVATAADVRTAHSQSVLTYHYDNSRTGWNPNETTLTPQNVPGLQLLASVSLDEQVDAQPLLVPGLAIPGQGTHDVLYVATENDTIYALDAGTGAVLFSQNFGQPVSQSVLPGQCNSNSASVGITSTPVIDLASSTMYVMIYTYEDDTPIYRLHALDLSTLTDKVAPAVVSASAKLANGHKYNFNASVSRQRAGLLAANGNIYAGFSSFCDLAGNLSRGWLLGWQNGSLTPLPENYLADERAASTNDFFLSSIWMAGYGVAADSSGNLFFATGNSDFSGTSYNMTTNLSESVIKMSPDLTTVESYFTPYGGDTGVKYLDQNDLDMGSGGVLLLPDQPNYTDGLAVAAGKVGKMYLLDRINLGGHSQNNALATFSIGGCWCGESYFQGWDLTGRVVSSGGRRIKVWQVQTSSGPTLVEESMSPDFEQTAQDPGFFTTVSSNGIQNAVIWAVRRPVNSSPADVWLHAFDPLAAAQGSTSWLFSAAAGTWPNTNADANIVPIVANGLVYVASYKQLAIFGLASSTASLQAAQTTQQDPPQPAETAAKDFTQLSPNEHEVFGTIRTVNGNTITVATRTKALVDVDATEAVEAYQSVGLLVDEPVRMLGSYDTSSVFHATVITRAKASPGLWPPDR
jgi:hypothetical protein